MTEIGMRRLSLPDCEAVLFKEEPVEISSEALLNAGENYSFLKEFSSGKLIYGISTGFGPMARYRIQEDDQVQLQYNLIRSHSTGSGNLFAPQLARAVLLARLNSLLKGYSGVHPDTMQLIAGFLNQKIYPNIFEHGGVGASGDLVQLAHLALNLIGEGEVSHLGQQQSAANALEQCGLKPLKIYLREGLSIINGTSAMTGVALINLIYMRKMVGWMTIFSAMTNELMESFDDHFSKELNQTKAHIGQQKVAAAMSHILSGSRLVRHRPDFFYNEVVEAEVLEDRVQEYYSLRCVPQVIGPVLDTWLQAEKVVLDELNSVSDNPVVDHHVRNIFHGGNFHGDYISLEMDKLKMAATKISMLSERQLNFLLNDRLNHKLPPFVNLGRLGFNLGMQGLQFTATSTVAENQSLSFPMYVHSIPNNNDNQDIVSMGCNAALMTRRVIDNGFEVLAIQLITLAHAAAYLKVDDRLADFTRAIYIAAGERIKIGSNDHPRYKEIAAIKQYLLETDFDLYS